jgi:hypothetical protein
MNRVCEGPFAQFLDAAVTAVACERVQQFHESFRDCLLLNKAKNFTSHQPERHFQRSWFHDSILLSDSPFPWALGYSTFPFSCPASFISFLFQERHSSVLTARL